MEDKGALVEGDKIRRWHRPEVGIQEKEEGVVWMRDCGEGTNSLEREWSIFFWYRVGVERFVLLEKLEYVGDFVDVVNQKLKFEEAN